MLLVRFTDKSSAPEGRVRNRNAAQAVEESSPDEALAGLMIEIQNGPCARQFQPLAGNAISLFFDGREGY
ncbi:hypothetical protein DTW90_16670 [Neorhizobium sp. P12A]|nr:hypothetical protein DTW90_16670 [Neorhizobium sp. P12A]